VQRRLGVAYSASAVVIGAILSVWLRRRRWCWRRAWRFCCLSSPIWRSIRRCAARAGRGGGGVERCRPDRRFHLSLWLAFGSLEFPLGQVAGKGWMVLLPIPWSMRCAAAKRLTPA
jgi:hypothetical protein